MAAVTSFSVGALRAKNPLYPHKIARQVLVAKSTVWRVCDLPCWLNLCASEMISGSVLISDAVFLELVNALNQYSDEEEEGHNDSEGKQEDGKEELPVTRKRKRTAAEGGFGHRN